MGLERPGHSGEGLTGAMRPYYTSGMNRTSVALFLCAVTALAQRRGAPPVDADQFRFRFVGPLAGNRVASVAAVPGDVNTYYAGAASGGIFKSVDGGFGWTPIFDSQPVA